MTNLQLAAWSLKRLIATEKKYPNAQTNLTVELLQMILSSVESAARCYEPDLEDTMSSTEQQATAQQIHDRTEINMSQERIN